MTHDVKSSPSRGDVALEFERRLAAPPEVVFRAWTDARHFERWFAPHTMWVAHCKMDARLGGVIHFEHCMEGGESVWVRGVYTEFAPPTRVAFDVMFSDQAGNVVERPGFARCSKIAATFERDGAGTLMRLSHSGLTRDQGEGEGWKQTLERLEAMMASA